ncbi:hypothetical protein D1007_10655 [Hordeum vulgare]|nr:hypothetical protein D1007_10655 [Hordeum vulgare]
MPRHPDSRRPRWIGFQRASGAAAITDHMASPRRLGPSTCRGSSFPHPSLSAPDAPVCCAPGGARAQAPAHRPLSPRRKPQAPSQALRHRRDPSTPPCEPRSSARTTRGCNGRAARAGPEHPLRPALTRDSARDDGGTRFYLAGKASSNVPDVLHGARRQYWRNDYIDHSRCARPDDNRIGAPSGYGGSNVDHHYNRRHTRNLAGNPRENRYEQNHGGGPWGWLCGDAQPGCSGGAHLLDGSCFGQTSGSGDRDFSSWTGWTHPHVQVEGGTYAHVPRPDDLLGQGGRTLRGMGLLKRT